MSNAMEQVRKFNDLNNNYLDVFKPDHLMAMLLHLFLYGLSNHSYYNGVD